MPQVDHDLEDEWVTLYHGDCRDVAETVAPRPADLLLTDPPYGMAFVSGRTAAKATVKSDGVRQGVRVVRSGLNECAANGWFHAAKRLTQGVLDFGASA